MLSRKKLHSSSYMVEFDKLNQSTFILGSGKMVQAWSAIFRQIFRVILGHTCRMQESTRVLQVGWEITAFVVGNFTKSHWLLSHLLSFFRIDSIYISVTDLTADNPQNHLFGQWEIIQGNIYPNFSRPQSDIPKKFSVWKQPKLSVVLINK